MPTAPANPAFADRVRDSLMPEEATVLSIEFKINLLRPAAGEYFEARGRVLKPGRNIMTCAADVSAFDKGDGRLVSSMLGTMMVVIDRPDLST